MPENYLLTLIAPPSLEENLVDWLLSREGRYGFTSFPVAGHSGQHRGLSLGEQVEGRKKQIRFEMHVQQAELEALLGGLKQDFAGTCLHYWVAPIKECGTLC
jgi:hypothetical protein